LHWHPKHSNPSIVVYYGLKSMLFTLVVLILIILFLLKQYEIVGQDKSPRVQYIQGDSGGICSTLGNDSVCDSKQKSSNEHGSDFGRLWSYDRLKLRIEGNDY